MSQGWKTQKGDEWWYENYWCEASADRAVGIVSIRFMKIAQGQLNEKRLHEFLTLSQKNFEGETVLLNLSNTEVSRILASLVEKNIVEFEKFTSSYSNFARITKLQEYEKIQTKTTAEKNNWWKLW